MSFLVFLLIGRAWRGDGLAWPVRRGLGGEAGVRKALGRFSGRPGHGEAWQRRGRPRQGRGRGVAATARYRTPAERSDQRRGILNQAGHGPCRQRPCNARQILMRPRGPDSAIPHSAPTAATASSTQRTTATGKPAASSLGCRAFCAGDSCPPRLRFSSRSTRRPRQNTPQSAQPATHPRRFLRAPSMADLALLRSQAVNTASDGSR